MDVYNSLSILVLLFVSGSAYCSSDCYIYHKTWSHDSVVDVVDATESFESCQAQCVENEECTHFTWYSNGHLNPQYPEVCYLFSSPGSLHHEDNCVSGPKICPGDTTTQSPPTTSDPVPGCLRPSSPSSGYWFCPHAHPDSQTCHLECHPGYAALSFTKIDCDAHTNTWTHSPDNLTCVPSLAMLTGGQYIHNNPFGHAELYGEGVHTLIPSLPQYRESHSVDYVDSHILACGDFYNVLDNSCVELLREGWEFHSNMTEKRKGHSSAVMLGKLVIFGGQISSFSSEYLIPSAGPQWYPGIELALSTWNSCSTKITAELHVVTGGVESSHEVWQYNVTSGEHKRLADMNHARHSHGCVFVREENSPKVGLIVAGGAHGHHDTPISSTEFYSFETGDWTLWGSLNEVREGVRLAVVQGGTVLAFGGGSGGAQRFVTVEKLDVYRETWEYAEDMVEARKFHAVTIVPQSISDTL